MMAKDAEEVAKAQAEAQREAEAHPLDETVPGGRYKVGDRIVNSEGDAVGKEAGEDLSSMKVDELRSLAEEKGVEGFETMRKAELVAALEK
jgi:hypothetical protein